MKKHQYVKENIVALRRLHKSGDLSDKMITDYKIYTLYQSYSHIKSKMERIQFVADDLGISWMTVRRALKNMESYI